ncbi:MAG: hypothetical protein AAGG68_17270 [Bacteroidota bacterium]
MQRFPYLLLAYLFTFVFSTPTLFSQENVLNVMQWYPSEKVNAPLVISIFQKEARNNFYALLPKSQLWQDYNFLLLEEEAFELEELTASINDVLNEEKHYNKNRIYLILAGKADMTTKYQALDLGIFAQKYHLSTIDIVNHSNNFLTERLDKVVLDNLLKQLQEQYLWQPDLDKIQEQSKKTVFKKVPNRGIGLQFGWLNFQSNQDDGSIPSVINNFGFNTFRFLKPHWMYEFNLDIGVSLPNPQDVLQDQVRSQIDFNAVLSGDDLEIDLNTTLEGHISAQLGIGVKYLLAPEKKWNPYAGLHLSFQNHIIINTEIDTTIVIEGGLNGLGSSGLAGNGRPNGRLGNLSDRNGNFEPTIFQYVTLSPKIGIQHHFSKRWFLDLNMQYFLDPKTSNQEEKYLNGLQFRAGLHYRFTGKARTYYDYLK